MNNSGRILYISHDALIPSGGVKVIYQHVLHLVQNGYPAYVVHNKKDFSLPWLKCNAPVLYFGNDFEIFPNDIVVIPEDHHIALETFRSIQIKKYVFCQNHYFIFKGLQNEPTWKSYGIAGIFCCSAIIRNFLSSLFGNNEVPVIHNAIPLDIFKPRKKKLQIAYMPRKRLAEVEFIANVFKRLSSGNSHIPWVCIDGVDEQKVAKIMGESAIFLSTSLYEGFGLPPLEAMASGCIVVGFHGHGGMEYATAENGFWCEEGNIIQCAENLSQAVSLVSNGDQTIKQIKDKALESAQEYTFARQEKDLLDFWGRVHV